MSSYSQELIEKSMPDLSKHVLTEIQSGGPISAYQLHQPDYGRMESCLILGTPEGIVIMGDFCPNRNHGCTSDYKYTLEWFAGELGIGYLLEKFGLEEKFQPELAAEGVKFWLDEMLADEDLHPEWRKWVEKEASRSFKEFCDILSSPEDIEDYFSYDEWGADVDCMPSEISELNHWIDVCEPYGPSLSDVRVLVAIQRRFAELYPQLKAQKEAAGEGVKKAGIKLSKMGLYTSIYIHLSEPSTTGEIEKAFSNVSFLNSFYKGDYEREYEGTANLAFSDEDVVCGLTEILVGLGYEVRTEKTMYRDPLDEILGTLDLPQNAVRKMLTRLLVEEKEDAHV